MEEKSRVPLILSQAINPTTHQIFVLSKEIDIVGKN
jgi:hypothetical protein